MDNEELWRQRFVLFTLIRLSGLALLLIGGAIAFTDLFRDGGWPLVGGVIAVAGALEALILPKLMLKSWEREDR